MQACTIKKGKMWCTDFDKEKMKLLEFFSWMQETSSTFDNIWILVCNQCDILITKEYMYDLLNFPTENINFFLRLKFNRITRLKVEGEKKKKMRENQKRWRQERMFRRVIHNREIFVIEFFFASSHFCCQKK